MSTRDDDKREPNYYDVLGVARTASEGEIKLAESALRKVYEAKAKQGDSMANAILVTLNQAYATLTTAHKRRAYDRQFDVQAHGFQDVAFSPRIGRVEKLSDIANWVGGSDEIREHTLLEESHPYWLLSRNELFGDE